MIRKHIIKRFEVEQTPDNQFWVKSLKWGWKFNVGLVEPCNSNTYDVVETFLDYGTAERIADKLGWGDLIIKNQREDDIKLIKSLLLECTDEEFINSCKTLRVMEKEKIDGLSEDILKRPREEAVDVVIKMAIARNSI